MFANIGTRLLGAINLANLLGWLGLWGTRRLEEWANPSIDVLSLTDHNGAGRNVSTQRPTLPPG